VQIFFRNFGRNGSNISVVLFVKGEIGMDYYDLIRKRHSMRNYDPQKPVSGEVLKRILNAGRLAPSAANRQPWEFIVISSAEMLEKVRKCYDKSWFRDAPHILIVKGNQDSAWRRRYDGYNSIETDLTIAMDHLVLAATNEGVGTCWIAAFDPSILRDALKLGEMEKVFAITPLGYPQEGYKPPEGKSRKSLHEVARFL